jgi:hypothetical protein
MFRLDFLKPWLRRVIHRREQLFLLLESGFDHALIWRAIFLHGVSNQFLPAGWSTRDWNGRCDWIRENVEKEEAILHSYNAALEKEGRSHLFIFDARLIVLETIGKIFEH